MRRQSVMTTRLDRMDAEIAALHNLFDVRFRAIEFQVKSLVAKIPAARELRALDSNVREMQLILRALEERVETRAA